MQVIIQDAKQPVLWNAMNRKKVSWAKFMRSQVCWVTYKKHRNQERKERKKARIAYEIKIAELAKSNPNAFYKYCNKGKMSN